MNRILISKIRSLPYINSNVFIGNTRPLFNLAEFFDGTLQKYRWEAGFPNTYEDSNAQWTHISGICYSRSYTELINTVIHQLSINRYPETLNIKFDKCE